MSAFPPQHLASRIRGARPTRARVPVGQVLKIDAASAAKPMAIAKVSPSPRRIQSGNFSFSVWVRWWRSRMAFPYEVVSLAWDLTQHHTQCSVSKTCKDRHVRHCFVSDLGAERDWHPHVNCKDMNRLHSTLVRNCSVSKDIYPGRWVFLPKILLILIGSPENNQIKAECGTLQPVVFAKDDMKNSKWGIVLKTY